MGVAFRVRLLNIDFLYIQLYYLIMQFIWDKRKREKNIKKHGIDFSVLIRVFDKPMLTRIDDRGSYGENRWISLGDLDGKIVVLVYTEEDDTIRLISARRATKNEKRIYSEKVYQ
jgi:uncharacterized DUF497 family protein